jgi:hypothetical protein
LVDRKRDVSPVVVSGLVDREKDVTRGVVSKIRWTG